MKPTRITEEPKTIYIKGGKQGHRYTFVKCDDGITYKLQELCKIVGLTYQTLSQRIRVYGWKNECIFLPTAGRGRRIGGESPLCKSGNEEWRRMSCRPRNRNLDKIHVGSLE